MGEKQSAEIEKSNPSQDIEDKGNQEKVNFLGQEYSPDEYGVACKNLADYFRILRKWADEEKNVEEEAEL